MFDNNLYLKSEKCKFFQKEVIFLEHIIMTEEMQMMSEKLKAIFNWSISMNITKIQFFHEIINYYWSYIQHFAKLIKSLIDLFKKFKKFTWEIKQQKVFEKIKQAYQKKKMKWHYDSTLKIILNTDVSDCTIAEQLQQQYNEKLYLIKCYAKTLNTAEQNYNIYDKELLVIVKSFKKWKLKLLECQQKI